MGPAGRTGLRYEALPFIFDAAAIAPERRGDVFFDVRTMEHAALEAFDELASERAQARQRRG